jgi:iron complex transport system permease protein
LGFSRISFTTIIRILAKNLPVIGDSFNIEDIPSQLETIIIQIRLPRIISGALVGAALAAAGVAYQGIFRNPMADPYVIGASSGAGLGAAVAIVLGVGYSVLGVNTLPVFAFFGSLMTVILVYSISRVGTKVPVMNLLLSGISVSIFLSAFITLLKVIAGERLHALTFWLMGGFSYSVWNDVWTIFPLIFFGTFVIYMYARDLNILVLGEEGAQHLGVEVERVKIVLLIAGALVTASAVSVSGLIGFIGLIIPHLTRILIGPDHRILLPTSTILGSSFLVMCDAIARIIAYPAELPVGVITALAGGPFFIYLLRKKREGYTF